MSNFFQKIWDWIRRLFGHKSNTSLPPVLMPTTSPGIWTIMYSVGMPPTLTNNQTFVFPSAPNSIHCVEVNGLKGNNSVSMSYHIDADPTTQFVSTQDSTQPGYITMYMQRLGDNLSGVPPYASYRFYCPSQSTVLSAGDFSMSAAFDPSLWTNVQGQVDAAGLQACLANLGEIGFVFGNPGIGATAHGVQVQGGNATFNLTGFTLA